MIVLLIGPDCSPLKSTHTYFIFSAYIVRHEIVCLQVNKMQNIIHAIIYHLQLITTILSRYKVLCTSLSEVTPLYNTNNVTSH